MPRPARNTYNACPIYEPPGELLLVGTGQTHHDNYTICFCLKITTSAHEHGRPAAPAHEHTGQWNYCSTIIPSLCCFKPTHTFSFGFFFLLFFPLGSGEADRGSSFTLLFFCGGWSLLGVSSAAEMLPCLKQRQGVQSVCRDGEKVPFLQLPSFKLLCTREWATL